MNYLGHFYLSHHSEGLLVGNFLADFVKGKRYADYPAPIAEGILMHRALDSFTDGHAEIKRCTALLRHDYGKFSGIIVDMYFDYFLASNWSSWSSVPLKDFSAQVYRILTAYEKHYPDRARLALQHMTTHDWLTHYAEPKGIEAALKGIAYRMTKRLGKPISFEGAAEKMLSEKVALSKAFHNFVDDIAQYAKRF